VAEMRKAGERDATAALREAEARGSRLLEQARHQATEHTNAARAEVEQTLDWARSQATTIVSRAQEGAEKLLTAAGLGPEAAGEVATAIIEATQATGESRRPTSLRPAAEPPAPTQAPAPTEAQDESE
jgi:F0F1-type ATP synthase membrane subunit b/b'